MTGWFRGRTLLLLLCCCSFARASYEVKSANILGLFPHSSESHFAVMRSLMTELARRGHNVTVYSSHRLNDKVEHLQEIIIEPEFKFWQELLKHAGATGGLHELSQNSPATLQKYLGHVGAASVDHFLAHPHGQRLLQFSTSDFSYDLIIVDIFYTEALLALGHAYNKPTIAVVSSDFEKYMEHVLENFVPTACTPFEFKNSVLDTIPGFWTRLSTIRECLQRRKNFDKYNLGAQEKLVGKYFTTHYQASRPPTIGELQSHLSVLLLNNHVPLSTPRPLLPNTIAAGGLHIRQPQELPWHIKRFIDEARAGTIYMNLGNEQLCADIPQTMLKTLFTVLGRRKERVVWTCHDVEQLPDLPDNFKIQHSVPQSDILAHPHMRVFIMNGDLLSLQEGLVRHVPMLGIPIFRNQLSNMDSVMRLGVGLRLDYDNLTTTSLAWALQTLIDDRNMPLVLRRVASEFRDRPLGALETSIYWINYVLRHKGGDELKTRGVGFNSSSLLHLFDLFIFYFVMTVLIVCVTFSVLYAAFFIWKRQQTQKVYSKLN